MSTKKKCARCKKSWAIGHLCSEAVLPLGHAFDDLGRGDGLCRVTVERLIVSVIACGQSPEAHVEPAPVAPSPGGTDEADAIAKRWYGRSMASPNRAAIIGGACDEAYAAGRARGIEEGKREQKRADKRIALSGVCPEPCQCCEIELRIADAIAKETK